jgi:imidazolonepropionase-like amidohydrolase
VELLVSAGQVLAGQRGERIADGAVLVQEDKIVAVGRPDEVTTLATPDVTRVHFPNGTLLPGLIDAHVHLAFDAGPDPVAALTNDDDVAVLLGMAARARKLLDSGVTTVRDLGDRGGLAVRLRDSIADGMLPGPRILAATAPLTLPGGHCWFLGGEVEGEQAIRDMVQRNAENGADVIKVMATGGHLTPGGAAMWESQFTTEELRVVVEEARRFGLPVAAHAHGTPGITSAVEAGVDTIEHCTWLGGSLFDVPAAVVSQIISQGIHVSPAISRNWRGFPKRFGEEAATGLLNRLRWLDEQGVQLAAGTDAGVPGAVFDDFVGGLEAFQHVGIPNGRIIELATVNAAAAVGLAGSVGQLAVGLGADLLVVDGDPLSDLAALRQVRLVLSRGRPHVPAELAVRAAGEGHGS